MEWLAVGIVLVLGYIAEIVTTIVVGVVAIILFPMVMIYKAIFGKKNE